MYDNGKCVAIEVDYPHIANVKGILNEEEVQVLTVVKELLPDFEKIEVLPTIP